jgi:hypothetical protein
LHMAGKTFNIDENQFLGVSMRLLLAFALFFTFPIYAETDDFPAPMTDENALGFDEYKKGDVIGFDRDDNPIFLGGIPTLELSTEVYRGTRSIAGEFPTSGFIGNCTANAVALDVVVTAGHCKGTGARISFAHRESGKSYSATCTRHPRYNTSTIFNDYTLCKLDTKLPAGSKLLTFNKVRTPKSTSMYVNGFGAPNVGTHYWGLAKLSGTSGSQDLTTCGPANLGGGDSGGTLIHNEGDRTLAKGGKASAVNSRGNSSCSWYNDYAHSEFQSWARQYETAKGVQLCGISADCSGDPEPPLDCLDLYEEVGECVTSPAFGCKALYAKFSACIKDAP